MSDLVVKFSEAAKLVSSNAKPIQETIFEAFSNHLNDVDMNDLPTRVLIIYEAVEDRLKSIVPPGDIGYDEARILAKDILYMEELIQQNQSP